MGAAINEFRADWKAIGLLGELMGRAGGAASTFASANTGAGGNELSEGLLGMLAAPLDRWQALGVANCSRAATLADSCATGLKDAAARYRGTDAATAARLDRTYPDSLSERVSPDDVSSPGTAATFTDVHDASRHPRHPELPYTGPDDPGEDAARGWDIDLDGLAEKIIGSVSVSGYLREVVRRVVGFDPFAAVATLVAGDWKNLLVQGMVFEDTAVAFTRIKENVDRGRYGIQEAWRGRAGEAARAWLTDYSHACAAHAGFCAEAGQRIKNFARSSYHAMQALDLAVEALLDAGLGSLLKKGEGIAIGVIGLARGEGIVPLAAAINAAVTPVGDAIAACQGVAHAVQSAAEMVAGNGEIAAKSWPGEPYRHPGA